MPAETVKVALAGKENDVQMARILYSLVSGASERIVRTRQGAVSTFEQQPKKTTR